MTDKTQILNTFKTTLISFVDELIGQFPRDAELILIRIFLKSNKSMVDVMNEFLLKLSKHKELIRSRNDELFQIDDFLTFGKLKGLSTLKRNWVMNNIDDDDKQVIWEWLNSFVFICEKYQSI